MFECDGEQVLRFQFPLLQAPEKEVVPEDYGSGGGTCPAWQVSIGGKIALRSFSNSKCPANWRNFQAGSCRSKPKLKVRYDLMRTVKKTVCQRWRSTVHACFKKSRSTSKNDQYLRAQYDECPSISNNFLPGHASNGFGICQQTVLTATVQFSPHFLVSLFPAGFQRSGSTIDIQSTVYNYHRDS